MGRASSVTWQRDGSEMFKTSQWFTSQADLSRAFRFDICLSLSFFLSLPASRDGEEIARSRLTWVCPGFRLGRKGQEPRSHELGRCRSVQPTGYGFHAGRDR